MAKAVLVHKAGSIYDDDPYYRYHFPRQYLRTVEAALGDVVVYYEPGRRGVGDRDRGGRRAYFATAVVRRIEADPRLPDHFYAFVEDYIDFANAVPFRVGDRTLERRLLKADGSVNKGQFGVNVRRLDEDEFAAIWALGMALERPDDRLPAGAQVPAGLAEGGVPFEGPEAVPRRVVETLVSRPFRDAAFQQAVQSAYGKTCALTGLKVINGGGRAEVEAAHIRPVASRGPDTVRNGLALSRTVHWMFDRGLLAVADDFSILAREDKLPPGALRLLNPDRRVLLPPDRALWPAPGFLGWHRANVFAR